MRTSYFLQLLSFALTATSRSILPRDDAKAQANCKPPLPSSVLLNSPPSADHQSLVAPLSQLKDAAAGFLNTTGVDSILIGVVGPQGLIWNQGFGRAQANGTDTSPPDENTIYRIASISKLFAAMEGYILRDKGVIQWDDTVQKYIPDFKPSTRSWKEHLSGNVTSTDDEESPITLRQLATHMSGLSRDLPYINVNGWPSLSSLGTIVRTWPTLQQMLSGAADIPRISPTYSFPVYSNTGFSLLGNALAAADGSNLTYSELIKRDIFEPLGMDGSSFLASQNSAKLAIPSNAFEVDLVLDGAVAPAGGQFSSTSDLSKVLQYLLDPKTSKVMKTSSIREWVRPLHTNYDNATEVGLLWEIVKLSDSHGRTQRFYTKAGDHTYFHSLVAFSRELQFGVIIQNTGTSISEFLGQAALQLLQPAFEQILEQQASAAYAGSWKNEQGDEIDVVVEDGVLSITKFQVGSSDLLLYEGGLLDRISLWSTGNQDEFRIAFGVPQMNVNGYFGCLPMWTSIDPFASNNVPLDLLYFDNEGGQRVLKYPSANVTLHL